MKGLVLTNEQKLYLQLREIANYCESSSGALKEDLYNILNKYEDDMERMNNE